MFPRSALASTSPPGDVVINVDAENNGKQLEKVALLGKQSQQDKSPLPPQPQQQPQPKGNNGNGGKNSKKKKKGKTDIEEEDVDMQTLDWWSKYFVSVEKMPERVRT